VAIRETLLGIAHSYDGPVRPAAAPASVEIRQFIARCAEDL
jgi:hypothetical protein